MNNKELCTLLSKLFRFSRNKLEESPDYSYWEGYHTAIKDIMAQDILHTLEKNPLFGVKK